MEITQKRTCFGCKSLSHKYRKGDKESYCILGYETGVMAGAPNETLPVEPCPKPVAQKDWTIAKTSWQKHNIDLLKVAYIALDLVKTVLYNHPDDDIAQSQKEVIEKAIAKAEGK
jgi:hypothetical protein